MTRKRQQQRERNNPQNLFKTSMRLHVLLVACSCTRLAGALRPIESLRAPLRSASIVCAAAAPEPPRALSSRLSDQCDDSEVCDLPLYSDEIDAVEAELRATTRGFDIALATLPVLAPMVRRSSIRRIPPNSGLQSQATCDATLSTQIAFSSYTGVAGAARSTIASAQSFLAVDGGAYQIAILTPTINGIVVPMLAIAFSTLTATTVNTLRQRQLEARGPAHKRRTTIASGLHPPF
jgi:hypothetical protein